MKTFALVFLLMVIVLVESLVLPKAAVARGWLAVSILVVLNMAMLFKICGTHK